MSMLRKNITISKEDYQVIKDFSRKTGISFSELLRRGTLNYVKEFEKRDLAKFLKDNCPYASEEEQKEFEDFMKTYDDSDEGRELTVNDIL